MIRKPSVVLFDLGDVVCEFTPARRLRALAQHTGLSEAEIDARLWQSGFSSDCDAGEYDLRGMIDAINEKLDRTLTRDVLAACWFEAFVLNEGVYAIAAEVRSRARVGMLTNNAPLLRASLALLAPDFERVFDPILFSYEFGTTKPNHAIFAGVQARLGQDPASILLIDDSAANIAAARAAGWQAERFADAASLAQSLDTALSGVS